MALPQMELVEIPVTRSPERDALLFDQDLHRFDNTRKLKQKGVALMVFERCSREWEQGRPRCDRPTPDAPILSCGKQEFLMRIKGNSLCECD